MNLIINLIGILLLKKKRKMMKPKWVHQKAKEEKMVIEKTSVSKPIVIPDDKMTIEG